MCGVRKPTIIVFVFRPAMPTRRMHAPSTSNPYEHEHGMTWSPRPGPAEKKAVLACTHSFLRARLARITSRRLRLQY
jgi:hypothetical protein